jgi:hypothetical protein
MDERDDIRQLHCAKAVFQSSASRLSRRASFNAVVGSLERLNVPGPKRGRLIEENRRLPFGDLPIPPLTGRQEIPDQVSNVFRQTRRASHCVP